MICLYDIRISLVQTSIMSILFLPVERRLESAATTKQRYFLEISFPCLYMTSQFQ
jgi:hypothetical protein